MGDRVHKEKRKRGRHSKKWAQGTHNSRGSKRTVKEELDLAEQVESATKWRKLERDIQDKTQTTPGYKKVNETKIYREETSKRITEMGKTYFRQERPKTFKEEIDKQTNTHSFCYSKMLACQARWSSLVCSHFLLFALLQGKIMIWQIWREQPGALDVWWLSWDSTFLTGPRKESWYKLLA